MENQDHSAAVFELMSTSPNGFLIFKTFLDDDHWVCDFANERASSLTGLENVQGATYADIFNAPFSRITAAEYLFPLSGCRCIVSFSARSGKNLLCTLTEIKEDVTARYHYKLWQDAEEIMQFGGWIWDIQAGKMDWTEGMYSLMGYPRAQMDSVERNIEFIIKHIHPDDVASFSRQVDHIGSFSDSYVMEFRLTGGDGVEKFLYLRGENISDPATGHLLSLCTIFNVSTLKLIQHELEQKVSDLNQSNADLEQFAYVASHDLQEPLRKIVSFGERLDQKTKETLNDEQRLYLDRILNATRRMQEMINNLLEFSRVSSATRVYTSTDLNGLMRSTLSDLEVTIQQKEAVISLTELPTIEAIPAQISQLFLNLISNSLKFTRAGVTPLIQISASVLPAQMVLGRRLPADRQYVSILFEDNGIGFDNTSTDKIFTIFQRLRGRSEFEGAGIGLAVCKKVVERHHGIIEARGVPGSGATFEVILPCVQH